MKTARGDTGTKRRRRAPVPEDVRAAVYRVYQTTGTRGGGNINQAAALLRVASVTVEELVRVGGAVQRKTLERVRARLAELEILESTHLPTTMERPHE